VSSAAGTKRGTPQVAAPFPTRIQCVLSTGVPRNLSSTSSNGDVLDLIRSSYYSESSFFHFPSIVFPVSECAHIVIQCDVEYVFFAARVLPSGTCDTTELNQGTTELAALMQTHIRSRVLGVQFVAVPLPNLTGPYRTNIITFYIKWESVEVQRFKGEVNLWVSPLRRGSSEGWLTATLTHLQILEQLILPLHEP